MKEQIIKLIEKHIAIASYLPEKVDKLAEEIDKLYQIEIDNLKKQLEIISQLSGETIPDVQTVTSTDYQQFDGRPNPQDVNPYDGRAILRKRKTK